MAAKSSGPSPKIQEILEGFNRDISSGVNLTKWEKKRIRVIGREKGLTPAEMKRLDNFLSASSRAARKKKLKREKEAKEAEIPDNIANYKMLQDMRWVYQQVDGKEKLLKLVQEDDKQFAFMVKELIKFETALKEKEKQADPYANQNFFVVIKGLEDEERVKKLTGDIIDSQQVKISINPEGEEIIPRLDDQKMKQEEVVVEPLVEPVAEHLVKSVEFPAEPPEPLPESLPDPTGEKEDIREIYEDT